MNLFGPSIGFLTLLIIGCRFPTVIYSERVFGYLCWPYMLAAGVAVAVGSLLASNDWISVVIGVLGAMLVWGSTELKEQAVRTEIGWYPFNPHKTRPPFSSIIAKWKAPHL